MRKVNYPEKSPKNREDWEEQKKSAKKRREKNKKIVDKGR